MHEHFDKQGKPTGHTVVHRESVWDDSARARAIQAVEYEQALDPDTGLTRAEAYKDQQFVVTDVDNFAAIALEQRRLSDEADAKVNTKNYPQGWKQGRKYAVRPATAEELEEAQRAKEVPGGD